MSKKKQSKSEAVDRMQALSAVADRFDKLGFQHASDVLSEVKAVQTIFPQYDVGMKVGGHPIERISLVHGPSQEGKTKLIIGLIRSFLERGHYAWFVDAEYTTPFSWTEQLIGPCAKLPTFRATRPRSLEGVRDSIKATADMISDAKAKGQIPEDTSGLFVIDSIRKLVPEHAWEALKKEASMLAEKDEKKKKKGPGLDGSRGAGAMMKANLVAQWLDELVPLMAWSGLAITMIARESENIGASMYETPWKLSGGTASFYDSSVVARVTRTYEDEGDVKQACERHHVLLYKLKVAGKEGKATSTYFHASNGTASPAGFDLARDVLEMAVDIGGVEKSKGVHTLKGGAVLGSSELETLRFLRANPEVLTEMEKTCREAYSAPEVENVEVSNA